MPISAVWGPFYARCGRDMDILSTFEAYEPRVEGSGTALTTKYEDGVPAHCPPAQAQEQDCTLYRVCASNPPEADDYASHLNSKHADKRRRAERKLKRDPNDCTPSGLSVWLTEKAMRHACKVFPFTEGRFVYKTDVKADEGKVLLTGAEEHHTYWPRSSTKLLDRAIFAFGPIDRATVDVG